MWVAVAVIALRGALAFGAAHTVPEAIVFEQEPPMPKFPDHRTIRAERDALLSALRGLLCATSDIVQTKDVRSVNNLLAYYRAADTANAAIYRAATTDRHARLCKDLAALGVRRMAATLRGKRA